MNTLLISYGAIVPPVLGFFVLTFIFLIAVLRAEKNQTNILFAGICFLGAIMNADVALVNLISDKILALQIDRWTYHLFVFSLPLYIRFVHSFLGIGHRKWIEGIAYLFSLSLLFFISSDLFIAGFHHYSFGTIAKAGPVFHVFSAGVGFTVFYCLVVLLKGLKSADDNHQKNRIKYLIGGMGITALVLALNILPVSGIDMYPMGNFSFLPAIFLAFGVLKYDLFDMGAMIRQGTSYFILTGVLTLVYIFFIYLFNALFLASGGGHSLLPPFLMALLIVLFFNPLRDRVQKTIDNLFYRGKYDYQKLLEEISRDMASLLKFDQIRDLLLERTSSVLQLSRVDLLMLNAAGNGYFYQHADNLCEEISEDGFDRNHPIVHFLEICREPLDKAAVHRQLHSLPERQTEVITLFDRLHAVLIIPLLSRNRLLGVMALGQRKSGELFVEEDRQLLMTIANQSVTAMEHAWAYEKISMMNLELERKVEERTADLRRVLEEKERTQVQLIRSESLAAIGQLVAGAAHELNNPLSSAYSLTQTTVETIGSWENVKIELRNEVLDDLDFSLREMRRARDIVRSLLDLSRQTQNYVESVNISAVIDNALRVLHNQYKKDPIVIERNYEEDLPNVQGNFANLGQVFINMIKNAIEALPDRRGTISLTTRYDRLADKVIVQCRDTGAGISSDQLKEIFNPFFTTKPVGKGTGLGLYISHEIIKKHEGSIRVESEKGKGTIFNIEIPRNRE